MALCPNGHDSASDDFCDVCGMRIGGSPATSPLAAVSAAPRPDPAHSAAVTCPRCGTPRTGEFCEACGFNFNGPRFIPAGPPPSAPPGPPPSAPPGPSPSALPSSPPSAPPGSLPSAPASPLTPSSAGPLPPAPAIPLTSVGSAAPSAPPAPSAESAPSARSAPSSPSMSSFPYPQATWTAVVGADRAYYERVQAVAGPEGAAVAFPSYCAERRFQLVGNQMRIGRRSVSRGLAPEIDLTGPDGV